MEGRLGRSAPKADHQVLLDQIKDERARYDWFMFRNRLLSQFGPEIPGIGREKDFVAKAQSQGFKTGIYLGLPAREWLMGAFQDGAFDRLRNSKQHGSKDKKRDKAFTVFFYYTFTSARTEQIADLMGYSGIEFPARLRRNFLSDLHLATSEEFKSKMDFNSIDFKKTGVKYVFPPKTEEMSLNLSRSKGGYLAEIKDLIDQGIVDEDQIGRTLSLDRVSVVRSLKHFRDRGLIPKTQNAMFRELSSALNSPLDSVDLDKLPLDMVSEAFVRNHPENFVSMTELAKLAGLTFSPRENNVLSSYLESGGVKVVEALHITGRKSKYVVTQEVESALKCLRENEALSFYKPITERKQVAGPEGSMPNYREMRGNYTGVFEILRKKGLPRFILKSSPVQVIAVPQVGFVVKKSDMPLFMQWVDGLTAGLEAKVENTSSKEQVVFAAS